MSSAARDEVPTCDTAWTHSLNNPHSSYHAQPGQLQQVEQTDSSDLPANHQ